MNENDKRQRIDLLIEEIKKPCYPNLNKLNSTEMESYNMAILKQRRFGMLKQGTIYKNPHVNLFLVIINKVSKKNAA